ncbi:MAG TPA: family 16 glycosylhydrolase [Arthrobacter sp.]
MLVLGVATLVLTGCWGPSPQPEVTTAAPATTSASATPTPTPTPPTGSAATDLNWGTPIAGDEFDYTGAPDPAKWSVYDSAGHAGNGIRSPRQATVDGSTLVITGTPDGTTAGMSAKFGWQKYGRWEVRAAASGDTEYHMVALLWPDSRNWPCDGEIDYAETPGDWSVIKFFHHYGCSNSQTSATMALDVTEFHNYALDWSPNGIVGYVDGVKWFEDNDPAHQPPGPMHQTLQLDWFPDDSAKGAAEMRVDWVRVYAAAPPPPAPSGESFDFAATGDLNPADNTSTTSHSGKNASSIIAGLNDGSLDNFLALGDFQYDKSTCSALEAYDQLWGPAKAKTYWTAGPNHDVEPGRSDVDRYMDGQCVSTEKSATSSDLGRFQDALEWYSFDKGNWHILVAPTATWRYDAERARAMTSEMDADLKAAKAAGKHLAVIQHDPYFTSTTSSHARFSKAKPWIDVFWKYRVRVLLSGSQHNYERTCPINNEDQCVADGMQQFQVSTGGIGLREFTSSPDYVERRFSDTWGHLRMSLKADGSYTWEFRPVSGAMQTDSGSRSSG